MGMVLDAHKIEITPEILAIISELDEFKGEWKHLSGLSKDKLKTLKKVASIESIGSSTRIEGSKLTDNEIESLLKGLDFSSFRSRDEEEVAGYAEAMNTIFPYSSLEKIMEDNKDNYYLSLNKAQKNLNNFKNLNI